ncbi:hypothetical protein BT69DRAFT_659948 [Atractiella rhizophila]|nr:hypothetical protein BT69DRAFT_659948 [Atractiella rhizophila]
MHMEPERLQRWPPKAALNLGGAKRPSVHASTTGARGGEGNEAPPLSTKKHGGMQWDRDEEGNSELEEEEEEEEEMSLRKQKKINSTKK